MTKLEKAADEHASAYVEGSDWGFICGARWALEQMTGEAAVKAATSAYMHAERDNLDVGKLLAAVREEIEG